MKARPEVNLSPTDPTLSRTDRERWSSPDRYDQAWQVRSVAAIEMAPHASWICDLGCGTLQSLKAALRSGQVYLPADLTQWTADTELCELNELRLPYRSLSICDTVFLLGVIEYIFKPAYLLEAISSNVEFLLLSYNQTPSEGRSSNLSEERRSVGWVNDFTELELLTLLLTNGFEIQNKQKILVNDSTTLVTARSKRFTNQQRARRYFNRAAYRLGLKR
jgi:hypothetical protein